MSSQQQTHHAMRRSIHNCAFSCRELVSWDITERHGPRTFRPTPIPTDPKVDVTIGHMQRCMVPHDLERLHILYNRVLRAAPMHDRGTDAATAPPLLRALLERMHELRADRGRKVKELRVFEVTPLCMRTLMQHVVSGSDAPVEEQVCCRDRI